MTDNNEQRLSAEQLYNSFPASKLPFDSTEEIESFEGVIEQERAVEALIFGLKVTKRNYNIYVAGESGTGKTSIVKSLIPKIAESMPVPPDWCYVHNFKKPESPIAISLPAGDGAIFKKVMEKFIEELRSELPKTFHSKEHQEKIQRILNRGLDRESEVFLELTKKATSFGFQVKPTKSGIVTIPMVQGKPLDTQEYANLSDEERHSIEKERQKLDPLISDFLQKTREIEVDTHREIQMIQRALGESVITRCLSVLGTSLLTNPQIENFLKAVSEDILENLAKFLPDESEAKNLQKKAKQNFPEYQVNVVVDNSELKGAPVIYELTPNYYNLIGRIEKRVEQGIYSTDFTMIKTGSIAKANGGFLILQARDLLRNPLAWDALKVVLKNQKLIIEDIAEHISFLPTSGLRPDPIPVKCKVIMIGGNDIYYLLHRYDEDFRKLFQVKADFDEEIRRDKRTALEYARFVATTCRNDGLRHVTRDGVAALIEFGSRLAGSKNKMTLKFNDIYNILIEANHFANASGERLISKGHIESAIAGREKRNSLLADKIFEMYEEQMLLIEVDGAKIGRVNGIAYLSTGDFHFGKPVRISASAYQGKGGVINIEREAKLSGNIHNKGVLIISGFLGRKYAGEFPLSLSVSICFEQSYATIDGDSASLAELVAIISDLAEVPVKQGIAVTGSLSQSGEVQPIGGINEKIEGFFKLCRTRGLTGTQGVIIPAQNVKNLMLKKEVRSAVRSGKFNIYAVSDIDSALKILTEMEPGLPNEKGVYPEGSINWRVIEKLRRFNEKRQNEK